MASVNGSTVTSMSTIVAITIGQASLLRRSASYLAATANATTPTTTPASCLRK
jgi:hypothetical protein